MDGVVVPCWVNLMLSSSSGDSRWVEMISDECAITDE